MSGTFVSAKISFTVDDSERFEPADVQLVAEHFAIPADEVGYDDVSSFVEDYLSTQAEILLRSLPSLFRPYGDMGYVL